MTDGDRADGGDIHVFPGVGPIDELVPMGSAAQAPAAADDEFPRDSKDAGNVRMFPGVGPIDELIPIAPPEKAPVAATMNADAFWGEDSQFLHQAIAAPRAAAPQTLTEVGPQSGTGEGQLRAGSGLGRWFAPVVLAFLCLAGLAFALDEAGVWGRPQGVAPRAGAGTTTRTDASRRQADARSYPPTRVPSIHSRAHGSATSRVHHRVLSTRHGESTATTRRTTPVKRPLGTSGAGGSSGTAGLRGTNPVATTPVETTPVDTTPVDTTPVDTTPVDTTPVDTTPVDTTPVDTTPVAASHVETTPAAPASSPPAGATASSGSTSAGNGSSSAASGNPTGSSGGTVVSHSGGSGTGAGDIGAGRGLPGPGGAPPP